MPKNKKADSSDSDSGPDDRLPAKKSKPAEKSSKGSNSEEDLSWPIDKRRFVKLREFKGKWMVDIREFYEAGDGELRPGKKGISLSIPQWQKFKDIVDEVDEAIKKNV